MDLVAPLAVTVQGSACDHPDPQSWSRYTKGEEDSWIDSWLSEPAGIQRSSMPEHSPHWPPGRSRSHERPGGRRCLPQALRECFREGPRGGPTDTWLMVSPWDFEPRGIQAPVLLWHGELDADAPQSMRHWLAKAIPTCRPHFFADEGHVSLIVKHAETIARSLAG